MSLDQLDIGIVGTVSGVSGSAGFRRRLMELGFVPGTPVERIPGGEGAPPRYRVRESLMALRGPDAQHVMVELA